MPGWQKQRQFGRMSTWSKLPACSKKGSEQLAPHSRVGPIMPMTLEQYAEDLTTRNLVWPVPPTPQPVKAKPSAAPLPGIRAVAWNIYGTLLSISTGNLVLKHPQKLIMEVALDKTIKEFNMWASMSRKPGQPSEYMGQLYDRALDQLKMAPSHGEKYPEIQTEKIWDDIVKKLQQKDYKFDAGKYGGVNDY